MATQVPSNEFVLGDTNRRAAILQSQDRKTGDALAELESIVRGSRSTAERVLEETLPAADAPAQPTEMNIFDKMKQDDELQKAALVVARGEIERLKKALDDINVSSERTIVRLSDQLDSVSKRAEGMEDQRNKFADYTMVVAERLKHIEESSRANMERVEAEAMRLIDTVKRDHEQLVTLLGETRTIAATAQYQKPKDGEKRPEPEGLGEDRPAFLRKG
jgi:hypothetical protein